MVDTAPFYLFFIFFQIWEPCVAVIFFLCSLSADYLLLKTNSIIIAIPSWWCLFFFFSYGADAPFQNLCFFIIYFFFPSDSRHHHSYGTMLNIYIFFFHDAPMCCHCLVALLLLTFFIMTFFSKDFLKTTMIHQLKWRSSIPFYWCETHAGLRVP